VRWIDSERAIELIAEGQEGGVFGSAGRNR